MDYVIQNDLLQVTVTTNGAQVKNVIHKSDATEHIWRADPAVWGYHSPILFPYTGKLKDGAMEVKGRRIENCPPHGFARLMEHSLVCCTENTVVLELTDCTETLNLWPYRFRLVSSFILEGDTLHHILTVENRDKDAMHFGIGYHPAFRLPFDEAHTYQDYELRFDSVESPLCLDTSRGGLVGDKTYYLGKNLRSIPLDEKLFANDSHCMTGLSSRTLGLYEKDSGRGVVCGIRGFPFVLIWSKPGVPQFVCIEPWNSTPSPLQGGCDWHEKPAAAVLDPGQDWSTTLSMSFIR